MKYDLCIRLDNMSNKTLTMLFALVLSAFPAAGAMAHAGNVQQSHAYLSAGDEALVSLPNGSIYWYTSPAGEFHHAMNMTLRLVSTYGLSINYSVGSYGAFVDMIGGYWNVNTTTGPYWFLFVWNQSSEQWSISNYGASSLNLSTYPIFAWYYTADNPSTFAPLSSPPETPEAPYAISSFRGSSGNGYVAVNSNLQSGSPSPHLSWVAHTGTGGIDTQPVVANGTVYFLTDGNSTASYLEAYNYYGSELWSVPIPGQQYQLSSPLIYAGMAIVTSTDGYVYAFNASSGRQIYSFRASASLTSSPEATPMGYLVLNDSGGLSLYNPNGTAVWSVSLGGTEYYTSPLFDGNSIFAASTFGTSSRLFDLSLNGSVIWNVSVTGQIRDTPSYYGSHIYVIANTTADTVYAFSESGTVLWTFNAGNSTAAPSSITATANTVYFLSGHKFYALNSSNGAVLWTVNTSNAFAGPSPFVFGRYLLFSTNAASTSLYVMYSNGTKLWNFTTPVKNDYSLSSPVFNGTSIFWGDDAGNLYAFQNLSVASVTYTQHDGTVNLTASVLPVIGHAVFQWSIGGSILSGRTASYHFSKNGNYTILLTVSYSTNTTATIVETVHVYTVRAAGFPVLYDAIIAVVVIVIVAAAVVALRRRKK